MPVPPPIERDETKSYAEYLAEAKPSKHEVVACRVQREDPDQVQAAIERVKAMEYPGRRETINRKGYACKP